MPVKVCCQKPTTQKGLYIQDRDSTRYVKASTGRRPSDGTWLQQMNKTTSSKEYCVCWSPIWITTFNTFQNWQFHYISQGNMLINMIINVNSFYRVIWGPSVHLTSRGQWWRNWRILILASFPTVLILYIIIILDCIPYQSGARVSDRQPGKWNYIRTERRVWMCDDSTTLHQPCWELGWPKTQPLPDGTTNKRY